MSKELQTINKKIVSQGDMSVHIMAKESPHAETGKQLNVLFSNPDKNSEIAAIDIVLQRHDGLSLCDITVSLMLTIGDVKIKSLSTRSMGTHNYPQVDEKIFGALTDKVQNIKNNMPEDCMWFERIDGLGDTYPKERLMLAAAHGKSLGDYPTRIRLYTDDSQSAQKTFPKLMKLLGEQVGLISNTPKICKFMVKTIEQRLAQELSKQTGQLQDGAKQLPYGGR